MTGRIIGTIEVREDYDERRSGETACNYDVVRIKKGEYPLSLIYYGGKAILTAQMDACLMESYYVNRVFTASSTDHGNYEDGERPMEQTYRWGDYDRTSCPPMYLCGGNHQIKLDDGWIITADYRGNYAHGAPMIWYNVEAEQKEEAA